jgi:hypothetical protein
LVLDEILIVLVACGFYAQEPYRSGVLGSWLSVWFHSIVAKTLSLPASANHVIADSYGFDTKTSSGRVFVSDDPQRTTVTQGCRPQRPKDGHARIAYTLTDYSYRLPSQPECHRLPMLDALDVLAQTAEDLNSAPDDRPTVHSR